MKVAALTILAVVFILGDGVYMIDSADMMANTEGAKWAIIALLIATNPVLFMLQICDSKDYYKVGTVICGVIVSVFGSAFVNTSSVASKPIEQTTITAQYESLVAQRDALSRDLDPSNKGGCEFRKNCVSKEERMRLVHINDQIRQLAPQMGTTPHQAANNAFGGLQHINPTLTPELILQAWIWLRAIFISLACAALGNAIKQELAQRQVNQALSRNYHREMPGKSKGNEIKTKKISPEQFKKHQDRTRKVVSIAERMKKDGEIIRVKKVRDQAGMKTQTVNNILRHHGYINE